MTHVLITGASSGIGAELAKLFASARVPMVLSATTRSADSLQRLAAALRAEVPGLDIRVFFADLAEPDGADHLITQIQEAGLQISQLVNNGGFGLLGLHQDQDDDKVRDMLQVNVMALSRLSTYFAKEMVRAGHGKILNLSSIAGYVVPHGLEAVYAASKAFVVSFSEGLAHDLIGTGVTCTHLAPGPVKTLFFARAGLRDDRRIQSLYLSAQSVARQGFDGMQAGASVVIPGWKNKLMKVAAHFSPSKRLTAKIPGAVVSG
ncbi:SDR family NAD(P)-dependent oxidoreductase [Pseudomonas guguanensis]|uniref:SDR family NAD(P)-dependent oxidoreductase n=1 Tax=Ectopseudomonas guguanensis TaxID=1198456 RepID=UPI003266656B